MHDNTRYFELLILKNENELHWISELTVINLSRASETMKTQILLIDVAFIYPSPALLLKYFIPQI